MRLNHSAVSVARARTFFDGTATIDLKDPAVVAAIAEAVKVVKAEHETSTAGLVANRDALKGEKQALADALKNFEGLDADEVRKVLAAIDSDEETKLISEGKTGEVIERRTKTMRDQFAADTLALNKTNEELTASLAASTGRVKSLVLNHAVRATILGIGGFQPGAVEDAISRASMVFSLDDKEQPVAMDGETVIRGKDGATPLGLGEWLTNLVDGDCKHWVGKSTGGDAKGSGDGRKGPGEEDLSKNTPRENIALGMGGSKS